MVDPGMYVLRTTAAFTVARAGTGGGALVPGGSSPATRREARGSAASLVMLLIGPLFAAFIRSSSFESTRWAESNLSSSDS